MKTTGLGLLLFALVMIGLESRSQTQKPTIAPEHLQQLEKKGFQADPKISPELYYPKGYHPNLLPFWPSDKPIFIPENQVPEPMKRQPTKQRGTK